MQFLNNIKLYFFTVSITLQCPPSAVTKFFFFQFQRHAAATVNFFFLVFNVYVFFFYNGYIF